LTLQQLEYFLAAYRRGSFSAAAEELHMAQPSLSEQVRRLEAELGVELFARAGRGLTPTEAGEALRPHAERTLAAAEAARESVVAVRELRGGIATFGTWGTARYYPGTDIVAAFRRRHPDVRVRLIGQNSFEVVEAVRRGDIEAGMVALPIDDRGLDVQPIMRDEIVYASADARRLRRPMTIAALAEAPLILSDASWGTDDPTRRHLAQLAQQAGVTIEPQIDVEDVEAAIDLAARGLGDTIAGRGLLLGLASRLPEALGWVPFADPLEDTFAFVWRRGSQLSPATRAFVSLAEERLGALARELEHRPPRRREPSSRL
jgi:DNA-binding transcriptional LysR family regulator